jgi:hypothetical protein
MSFGNPNQSKVLSIKANTNAGEVIIGEMKDRLSTNKYQQNADGSNTLVLERWNS